MAYQRKIENVEYADEQSNEHKRNIYALFLPFASLAALTLSF